LASRDVTLSEAAVSRRSFWAGFLRDRRGVVGVALAVLLPVLVGFAGIGIEVGLWFAIQRQNQSAADAAAISAGLEYAAEIQRGVATDPAAAAAAATTAANCNLFSTSTSSSNAVCPLPSSTSNTIALYSCFGFTVGGSCNTSSSNGAPLNAVQVVLTQPLNTTFANFVTAIWGPNINTVNVRTTAIATFPQTSSALPLTTSACILALAPSADSAVLVNTGAVQNLNCWVASDSTSASSLNCNNCTIAGPTNVVGGDAVSNNGHLNGLPNRTYASAIADPYGATLTHAFLTAGMPKTPCSPPSITGPVGALTYTYPPTGNCVISNLPNLPPGSNIVLSAGTQIANGLSLTGPATMNLSPGTYWITDGNLGLNGLAGNITLACPTCSPGGAGVTMIFTQGAAGTIGTVSEIGNVTTILNAPGAGAFAGLLMVQDTLAGASYLSGGTIGNAGSLGGLIYFPSTNLSFVGNIQTDTSNCLVTVANILNLTGTIGLNDAGCATAGLTTVPTVLSVFLAV